LAEAVIEYMKKYRIDSATGKATFAIVQAEDELAAIGMALGAGWAGARAMTATSGPGISLMSEFVGLGYYAEIPVVIFDVQRMGPSTGLPTRTSQGNVLKTALLSHGDTKHLLLFPCSVKECFTMAVDAFDIAEEFQTPVFVMSDLDLGMNNWMADPFPYPEKPMVRGKVLTADDLNRLGGFQRYKDVDGDGIGYRTLPGTNHPAAGYFTRGSGHNEKAIYSERDQDYVNNMDRLTRKFDTARNRMPLPVIQEPSSPAFGILAYGTSHWAVIESLDQLKQEHDIEAGYCRVRGFPFNEQIEDFIRRCQRVYVVEQNRDAQMFSLLRMEIEADDVKKLRSVLHYSGLPIDARTVTDSIVSQEEK
jgi:2-oxoglutarate ferredoxin oxidoreductase subunit alpha